MKLKIIITCLAIVILFSGCAKCVKSHKEIVHHPAWTQLVYINKMWMPIFHPAYDAERLICDEYEKTN